MIRPFLMSVVMQGILSTKGTKDTKQNQYQIAFVFFVLFVPFVDNSSSIRRDAQTSIQRFYQFIHL